MKVRIGIGLANATDLHDGDVLADVIDDLERLRFDSVWFTERVNGAALDPLVAMAFAAARTTRLKFGTSVMVLPGRNPVLLAKAIASLDRLSDGRCLPAFGLGVVASAEQQAFGVARGDRAPWFDEALPLMRRLWREDDVHHAGARFTLDGVRVEPKPVKRHVDVWLGGAAPAELRRCGRLGDGWLPSFATPAAVERGIALVHDAASAADRAIDPEHFGVLLPYVEGPIPDPLVAVVRQRDADADPSDVIFSSHDELARAIARYVEVAASKFVVTPFGTPRAGWRPELEALADALLPLQT